MCLTCHDYGQSSQENKKYLKIETETGTFVLPVESAVGCIVSEQEISQMLTNQLHWLKSNVGNKHTDICTI